MSVGIQCLHPSCEFLLNEHNHSLPTEGEDTEVSYGHNRQQMLVLKRQPYARDATI